MLLSRRATRPAPLPTIRHCYSCTLTARSPSPPTAASAQCRPTLQTAFPTTLARLLATANCSAPRSNTWWVWDPVTTRCSCQVFILSIRLFPLRDLAGVQHPSASFFLFLSICEELRKRIAAILGEKIGSLWVPVSNISVTIFFYIK